MQATDPAKLAVLYSIIARTLPQEGRDYTVSVTQVDGRDRVTVTGITPMGVKWVPFVLDALAEYASKINKTKGEKK